jgi:hypothetical protein
MNNIWKIVIAVIMVVSVIGISFAAPTGIIINSNVTEFGRNITPANRTDPGGTITTLTVDATQQDAQWKAYVGNITGSLRLEDTAGNVIYQWSLLAASVTGEIYASRSNSISWTSANCSNITTIQSEQTALGITSTAPDSIQNTFNETTHPAFAVAGRSVANCNATSTFVNSARQAQASAAFPVMLLHDQTNLIYATIINQDYQGYNGATTYDFQLIVADNPTTTSTTYYFYAELGS